MKKFDLISFLALVVATIGLIQLRFTGMAGHIIISAIALVVMIICVIVGKKDWKVPALEILYRAFYLVALITGIVMVAAEISGAVSIVHKVACGLFTVLFIVNFITKLAKKQ